MKDIEVIKHECLSPIPEIKVGTYVDYSGFYVNGREEGYSKVKRIFLDEFVGEMDPVFSIYAELENGKLKCLGFANAKRESWTHPLVDIWPGLAVKFYNE